MENTSNRGIFDGRTYLEVYHLSWLWRFRIVSDVQHRNAILFYLLFEISWGIRAECQVVGQRNSCRSKTHWVYAPFHHIFGLRWQTCAERHWRPDWAESEFYVHKSRDIRWNARAIEWCDETVVNKHSMYDKRRPLLHCFALNSQNILWNIVL